MSCLSVFRWIYFFCISVSVSQLCIIAVSVAYFNYRITVNELGYKNNNVLSGDGSKCQ